MADNGRGGDRAAALSWLREYCGVGRDVLDALPVGGEDGVVKFEFGKGVAKCRKANSKRLWWEPKGGTRPPFWPVPDGDISGTIWLTEGESDAICARAMGLDAYAVTKGAKTKLSAEHGRALARHGVKTVNIVFDADDAGRKGAEKTAKTLAGAGLQVRNVDLAEAGLVEPLEATKDIRDAWRQYRDPEMGRYLQDLAGQNPPDLDGLKREFERQASWDIAEWVEPPDGTDLGYLDVSKLLESPPEPPGFVVEDMFPRGELSFLVSDGGVGKSWLLGVLAETLRCGGQTFLGQPCEPCSVVFLDMELSHAWFANRLNMIHAGLVRRGIIEGAPVHEIHYLSRPALRFDDAPLFLGRDSAHFVTAFDYLRAVVKCTGSDALIVDPLASLWGDTEENSANETATVCVALQQVAQATGAAVIVAHHTNKGRQEERGSTAIRNAAAAMFTLSHAGDDMPGDNMRILRTSKARHAAPLSTCVLCFDWMNDLFEVKRLDKDELAEVQQDAEQQALERNVETMLSIIRDAGDYELNQSELRAQVEAAGVSQRATRKAIEHAERQRLVKTKRGNYNAKLYALAEKQAVVP